MAVGFPAEESSDLEPEPIAISPFTLLFEDVGRVCFDGWILVVELFSNFLWLGFEDTSFEVGFVEGLIREVFFEDVLTLLLLVGRVAVSWVSFLWLRLGLL